MKLLIPKQTAVEEGATPGQPLELKKLIATLPNANMGELTKRVYKILREINRQPLPVGDRYENMNMLRQPADNIFSHLKKYFINRTLPLPEKSRKIVNLNQSLLQEMTYGYKIILAETETGETSLPDEQLTLTCYRCLRYLSELLLRCSEIYAPPPAGFWRDVHQIYLFAEKKQLHRKPVKRDADDAETHIENIYKQILLFVLARPIALPQSDNERVFQKLFHWASHAQIDNAAQAAMIDRAFFIKCGEDIAPDYLTETELKYAAEHRLLNVDKLLDHIQKLIDLNRDKSDAFAVGDAISTSSLKMLLNNWGTNAKRRFTRANRQGRIEAVIGLTNIADRIIEKSRVRRKKFRGIDTTSFLVPTEQAIPEEPQFTLETINNDAEPDNFEGYMTHTEIKGEQNDAWDMVARGTVLTETYEKEKRKKEEDALKLKKSEPSHWKVVNFSAGGYCLRWDSDETSRAQIGELIALYEKIIEDNYEWRIGIIRWMQFTREHGLEIGVQIISPAVNSASASRKNRPNDAPFNCLVLPAVKALKQPSTVVLPAHAFRIGDRIIVKMDDKQCEIALNAIKEHSGAFTQFHFARQKDVTKNPSETSQPKDDFDEIWSSL